MGSCAPRPAIPASSRLHASSVPYMTRGASSVRLGRFKPMKIKEMMHGVLHDKLQGVTYSSENVSQLTKEISEDIKNGLKGAFGGCPRCISSTRRVARALRAAQDLDRYKFVVQVVIGEQRGEGVRCSPATATCWLGSLVARSDGLRFEPCQCVSISISFISSTPQDGLPLLLGR